MKKFLGGIGLIALALLAIRQILPREPGPSPQELELIWDGVAQIGKITAPCKATGRADKECLCQSQQRASELLLRSRRILEKYPNIRGRTLTAELNGEHMSIGVLEVLFFARDFSCP